MIVRQALENLGVGELRETILSQRIYGLAILEQADYVMNSDTRTFDCGIPLRTPTVRTM